MKKIIKTDKPKKIRISDYFKLMNDIGDCILIQDDQNKISSFASQKGYKVKTEKFLIVNPVTSICESCIKVTLKEMKEVKETKNISKLN